ncbi:hypothetical protein AC249_AIPGENE24578 [Exaiptasia diaphana]|nr:hypothetical protein AC249_AIPGENE24578 [Exaiptasia diaphana]
MDQSYAYYHLSYDNNPCCPSGCSTECSGCTPWTPIKEPSWRDPKERGPLYSYYSCSDVAECMDSIEEDANDILDTYRYRSDPSSYKERERFETYVKVNDFFGIFTIYLCMMDEVDRDYKKEEMNPERLNKYIEWIEERSAKRKSRGLHHPTAFDKIDYKLQTFQNLHMNKNKLVEMAVNEDDDAEHLVGADDVMENLREIVKLKERVRNGMNQSLKAPLKAVYSKLIDQVHSFMYHSFIYNHDNLHHLHQTSKN